MPPGRACGSIWDTGGARGGCPYAGGLGCGVRRGQVFGGLGQHLVDVVDVAEEARRLAVAGLGHGDFEVGADAAGISAEHDDAVGEQHGLLDVVGDDEDGLGGDLLAPPELEQFAAQVLGGEDIEGGERLVHEEDFGLDDEGAGKADALLHAAGEFLGIGGLEAIETDGVEHAQARLRRSMAPTPRALSGASTFSRTVSQGNRAKLWKTMATLGLPSRAACRARELRRRRAG